MLGILLNKRREDPPEMPWKKGNLKLLERNSLNAEFYRTYLKQEFGIERYEWETCGYSQDFPDGKHFVHLPFYQTNTSQYCTLAAGCQRGVPGKTEASYEMSVLLPGESLFVSGSSADDQGGTILCLPWTGKV